MDAELKEAMARVAVEATRVDGFLREWTEVELTTTFREQIPGCPYPTYGARIEPYKVSDIVGGHVAAVKALFGVLASKSCPRESECPRCPK